MPEHSMMKPKHQRPTSDIILETGRKVLTEVEKSAVADSNREVSMLLARSRSLDVLSSSGDKLALRPSKTVKNRRKEDAAMLMTCSSPAEERDCEQLNVYVANGSVAPCQSTNTADSFPENNEQRSMKAECESLNPNKMDNLTLLKEKPELNNNSRHSSSSNDNYPINNTNRSSFSSSISTSSSNYSGGSSKSNQHHNHNKLQRRSSSTLEGASFQEVSLKTEPIRMTGYLEKRSKVLGWKKFWFVLDGRLLTYYKSKADYESLSACCGCINLGIATTVRPIQIRGCKGYPLQIVTRSQVYYLRSQEKPILEQWLIAIQEAASSPPSTSVLTSWNSYSGSQYFKNAFASQSQWSLNNSSDDISNVTDRLGNLPDTFYQKRDRDYLALPNSSSHVSPGIQKYHSFASLQTPIVNDLGDKRKFIISSTENLRDLKEANGRCVRNTHTLSSMQQSTSLLQLDSSPQAAELRKELTRKLSIGSPKNGAAPVAGPLGVEDGTVPTPKFLLLTAKKKLQLGPEGENNESHDYAEIGDYMEGTKVTKPYENCDVEKHAYVNSLQAQQQINRQVSRGESVEKEGNIYEHVETGDPMPTPVAGTPVWEPLSEGNNTIANNKRFPMHRMSAGSNRNSLVSISELPEDVNSISPSPIKTPVLTSIPESSWRSGIEPYKSYHKNYSEDDLSSCRSESFRSLPCVEKTVKKRKGKAFSGFLSKVFGKNKGKGKSDSLENIQRQNMVITGPVDLRAREMQENKMPVVKEKKPPFGGPPANNLDVVKRNSGSNEEGLKTSPVMPGSRMTINNTVVLDELKQKVGHITLKRTNSKDSSSTDREPESPPKSNGNAEASRQNSTKGKPEPRVPYVPRSNPVPNGSASKPVLVFQTENKSFESNTDDEPVATLPERQSETQVASICLSPEYFTTPSPCVDEPEEVKQPEVVVKEEIKDTPPIITTSQLTTKSATPDPDFQTKLAKFNRLSQRLSASLIAASLNAPPYCNHPHISRSHSCKASKKKGKYHAEEIPPLPPKKKNSPSGSNAGPIAIYDVPLNNKPVRSASLKLKMPVQNELPPPNEENSIAAYIRGITKKNSTPDIVFSGTNAKLFGLRDDDPKEFRKALDSNNSEDNFDVHKSSPSLPPPRPPKPPKPTKPKSLEALNRSKRNSESSSSTSSETVADIQSVVAPPLVSAPYSLPMQTLKPVASPAASSKSLEILDTLDTLSDAALSDTKASNSPPDSPKGCPLHPDACRDDLSLSTIARTPDSMMTVSDSIMPDSLISTPDTEIYHPSGNTPPNDDPLPDDESAEPISINKLEIVIRDNDGSPGLVMTSPINESRMDSLERKTTNSASSVTPNHPYNSKTAELFQNIKFATVSTLIQEFETVQENEDEISELYDDFPAEFYTPTPSSFSGYCPSDNSSTSTDSPLSNKSSSSVPSNPNKRHDRIDAIRNSGMEQLEAFLSFGSSSDDCSFESCAENLSSEDNTPVGGKLPPGPVSMNNNNNVSKKGQNFHAPLPTPSTGVNRTGAISRLGHSSAIGHLQKILTSDVK